MNIRSKRFVSFVILAIMYAAVNFIAAPPRSTLDHYHITSDKVHLLNATIVVPVVAVWFIALFGYEKIRNYSTFIEGHKESHQVRKLTQGVMIFAYWLPVTATASAVLNLFGMWHPGWHSAVTIIVNYLSLLFPLAGFWVLSQACQELGVLSKRPTHRLDIHLMTLALILIGVGYGYLIASAHDTIYSIYHTPIAVVLLTLTVPYIFSWYLGLSAVNDLLRYSRDVSGLIYHKSWNKLAFGIVWIVVLSIILQYVAAVSAKLNNLPLNWILLIIYILIPIIAVGFIFVAVGARQLTKIEEA